MARRPKGSGKINFKDKEINKYKEIAYKSNNFAFKVGDYCRYVGGLLSEHKNMCGFITKRKQQRNRIDYSILFDDGVERDCVIQTTLVLVEEVNS